LSIAEQPNPSLSSAPIREPNRPPSRPRPQASLADDWIYADPVLTPVAPSNAAPGSPSTLTLNIVCPSLLLWKTGSSLRARKEHHDGENDQARDLHGGDSNCRGDFSAPSSARWQLVLYTGGRDVPFEIRVELLSISGQQPSTPSIAFVGPCPTTMRSPGRPPKFGRGVFGGESRSGLAPESGWATVAARGLDTPSEKAYETLLAHSGHFLTLNGASENAARSCGG
jgi:hypothetical protein